MTCSFVSYPSFCSLAKPFFSSVGTAKIRGRTLKSQAILLFVHTYLLSLITLVLFDQLHVNYVFFLVFASDF